jgi:hypothetical protein
MRPTFESALPWWIAGPVIGLVIVTLLSLVEQAQLRAHLPHLSHGAVPGNRESWNRIRCGEQ